MLKFLNDIAKGYVLVCLLMGAFIVPVINSEESRFYDLMIGVNLLSIFILVALVASFFWKVKAQGNECDS